MKRDESEAARMISIDGSQGEGGGQILRTALSLSLVTGKPFTIAGIRAGRERPGLLRQHLAAVEAAVAVSAAKAEGALLHSTRLRFVPGETSSGEWRFSVGSAGSATLVFQTVLPALLRAPGPSKLVLEGGTHNPFAPPFDHLEKAFLPIVARMGPRVVLRLERPGFYPAGGGRFSAEVSPAPLARVDLPERGALKPLRARAIVSRLPRSIAERELAVIAEALQCEDCRVEEVRDPVGPGNVVLVECESEGVTEVFTGFGERRTRAETVAAGVAAEVASYLAAGVPVGSHLADQLLLPFALAGGGSYLAVEPSEHVRTNAEIIRLFLPVRIDFEEVRRGAWRVEVGGE